MDEGQTDREMDRYRNGQTYKRADRHTDKHKDVDVQTNRYMDRHINGGIDGQMDKHKESPHANTQTDG